MTKLDEVSLADKLVKLGVIVEGSEAHVRRVLWEVRLAKSEASNLVWGLLTVLTDRLSNNDAVHSADFDALYPLVLQGLVANPTSTENIDQLVTAAIEITTVALERKNKALNERRDDQGSDSGSEPGDRESPSGFFRPAR